VTSARPIRLKLAIRTLAQLTCRSGDIHFRYDEATESQEGIALQKQLQRDRPSSYQREGNVTATWSNADVELVLSGRADGWDLEQGIVEEFKTTRVDPARLFAHAGNVHLGQLRLLIRGAGRARAPAWRAGRCACCTAADSLAVTPRRVVGARTQEFSTDVVSPRRALLALRVHATNAIRCCGRCFPVSPGAAGLAADVFRMARWWRIADRAPTGAAGPSARCLSLRAMAGVESIASSLSSRTTGEAAEAAPRYWVLIRGARSDHRQGKICFMPERLDPEICCAQVLRPRQPAVAIAGTTR
jgi:hypothetical protein